MRTGRPDPSSDSVFLRDDEPPVGLPGRRAVRQYRHDRHIALVLLGLVALTGGFGTIGRAHAVTLASEQSAPRTSRLRAAGRFFVDHSGRVVILRGVNLAGNAKVPPFKPCAGAVDMDRIAALGMNVVRLLFLWEAYEPEPGCYNESYLADVDALARAAGQRGIHVIIDLHQDGFSRFASRGSGDGFPAWAVSHRGWPAVPDNGPRCKNWQYLMTTDLTMHRSFTDFFADTNGVRTRYLTMLGRIAPTFAESPGVIGYDLMNEPWGDERRELEPFYRDAAAAIVAAHPAAILFLEGHITTNCGLQSNLPRPMLSNVAYAPHYYKPSTVVLGRWNKLTLNIHRAFARMGAKSEEWGAPLFVGEFGIRADTYRGGEYTSHLYDQLDARLASGAQWNYTPHWNERDKDGWNVEDFNILDPSTGAPRPNFRPRPYPRLTAGLPHSFQYQDSKSPDESPSLTYLWENHPELGATEIFLPAATFPGDSTVIVQPADAQVWRDEARQLLVCRSTTRTVIQVRVESGATALR